MADPVSLIAAGVGIADVAFRLIIYLKDVKVATETIDDEISGLINEVEDLMVVHGQLEQDYLKYVNDEALGEEEKMLWFNTGKTLKNGQKLCQKLEGSVKKIYGDNRAVTGKRDGLIKQHRKRVKDPIISGLRDQIGTYHGALQIWLSCITMHSAHENRENQKSQFEQLGANIKALEGKLVQVQDASLPSYEAVAASTFYRDLNSISLSVLSHIGISIDSIGNSITSNNPLINEHFDTPKPVDPFYTGRVDEAERLTHWLLPESSQKSGKGSKNIRTKQKRFVIYGIGGSGKTQFCCKFAEDNRDSFWGVFWVDGSSHSRLKQTLSLNVSTVGGVEPNEKAALHWLSNLNHPWLLIIDNADDPDLRLDEYFPRGNRGHVLVTTRNPTNKSYGTVGDNFFEFHGLNNDDASCLLLKASGQVQPWDSVVSNIAMTIAKTLGYLALAITHAGRTIREQYCKLHEYLDFYERQWKKTRQTRQTVKAKDAVDELGVFFTFELNREAIEERNTEASKDALQLLDTFAFLHNQDIRFDILRKAVTNSQLEHTQQEEDKKSAEKLKAASPPPDWSKRLKQVAFAILAFIYENRSPSVIRAGRAERKLDSDRLRKALRQLTQFSLIIHSEKSDSYSIHPLVHKWARERPGLSVAEQSVWCEAAAVLLSHCILIPPLGNTTYDEDVRKYILPHVDHVRECQQSIEQRIRDKRMARMKPLPVFDGGFNREKAFMYAKFSLVYAQNGRWEEAKRLQLAVKDFTMQVLGIEHATTRRVTLLLSRSLYHLGQSDDSSALEEKVLDACIMYLGADHHDTLVAKCTLGTSRFLQGRLSAAKVLQEEAVDGLKKHCGLHDEETLNAIDCLGKTVLMFFDDDSIKRARELHLKAMHGMRKLHGRDHIRTLEACENMCTVAIRSGNKVQLEEAHEMMIEVLDTRKRKLGKEHAYTLLAMVNLALVKSGLSMLNDAEALILEGLPIAERNLGTSHIAYLWGRYQLCRIWIRQKRWKEAEQNLFDVTERQRDILQGRGKYHPDRLGGLVELATVYNALGKFDKCDKVVEEALAGFEKISLTEHPVVTKLKDNSKQWAEERRETIGTDPLLGAPAVVFSRTETTALQQSSTL
ncbi:tetratricopeptide repeat domain-containing protein [Clathrospora elynae]|uniref:Tetratricopeptide repeat domain-containing protein n=1 Tax=Clathrospora elynae TaxID=706981 RepID=A0A6A5SYL5_9PLEO|nr:tetratricopeptide repeat domain-containing protein [Clathrospora elynae]